MFKLLGFILKIILLIGGLFAVSQLEYKGHKIETYFVELFKSKEVSQGVNYVKTVVGDEHAKKEQPTVFKSAKAMSEYTDSEKKELQSLMDE